MSEAMEYLLSRKNLDDIPVSEIAKMAGVSRRTFTAISVISTNW